MAAIFKDRKNDGSNDYETVYYQISKSSNSHQMQSISSYKVKDFPDVVAVIGAGLEADNEYVIVVTITNEIKIYVVTPKQINGVPTLEINYRINTRIFVDPVKDRYLYTSQDDFIAVAIKKLDSLNNTSFAVFLYSR